MTRIVIGGRSRVLWPKGTFFVAGGTLLADPQAHETIFEAASQIVWAWYALDANGLPDFSATMRGTELLLRILSLYRRPLIMLSTDAVFSGLEGGYSETDVAKPLTEYGRIKLAQEGLMADYPRVRFTTFGPSYNLNRSLLIEMVARGEITIARPHQLFSPIATSTLNEVLRTLPSTPRVYHLTSEAVTKTDCCRAIEKVIGVPPKPVSLIDERPLNLSLQSATHRFALAAEIIAAVKVWRGLTHPVGEDVTRR